MTLIMYHILTGVCFLEPSKIFLVVCIILKTTFFFGIGSGCHVPLLLLSYKFLCSFRVLFNIITLLMQRSPSKIVLIKITHKINTMYVSHTHFRFSFLE